MNSRTAQISNSLELLELLLTLRDFVLGMLGTLRIVGLIRAIVASRTIVSTSSLSYMSHSK